MHTSVLCERKTLLRVRKLVSQIEMRIRFLTPAVRFNSTPQQVILVLESVSEVTC